MRKCYKKRYKKMRKYDKIKNYLLYKGLFERNDFIERLSEDNIQFLQNEMKLKSNLSLESCEIEL